MGIDLSIMPAEGRVADGYVSCTKLQLSRDYELFDALTPIITKHAEKTKAYVYHGDEYGQIKETAYGQDLVCIKAKHLRKFSFNGMSFKNKAVFKYIKALDKKTRLIIYWH